jgi:hypothetical protein
MACPPMKIYKKSGFSHTYCLIISQAARQINAILVASENVGIARTAVRLTNELCKRKNAYAIWALIS